jgi:chemotaxis protein methyltransferase CheR
MRLDEAVGRLATLVEQRLGLGASLELREALATHLEGLAPRRHWETYLQRLESALPGDAELRALADRITVGETYFFRHQVQLEALVERVLPQVQQGGRAARVLSAGCSTGEEAYSLAILGRESPRVDAGRLFIVGVDLSPRAIDRARRAHYAPWALRATPDFLLERWFDAQPDHGATLRAEVRDAVLFEERNLLDANPGFWAPGSFDVILCRNVLIYFTPETARRAVAQLEQALTPGGFLFLGPSENLRGLSDSFEMVQAGDAFYFQRTRGPRPSPRAGAMTPQRTSMPRVTPPPPASEGPARAWCLFEEERYAEASQWLEALPEHEREQPLMQLLRAALHLQAGCFQEAERLGAALAEKGSPDAGAHYLLGLCREQAGDGVSARACYERAVHLEPTFALGHLRLGMLARREGAPATARVALRLALSLLAHERPAFLSLFGGGFGRHGLMQVCQRELSACAEGA